MLTSEIIRDVSRALPWLASEPRTEPIPTGMSPEERTKFLGAYAQGLRHRYESLYPVVDRAGRKLMAELEELTPAEIADPEGEGAEALEKAESYFHTQRADLARLRATLIEADAPPDHDAFDALNRLGRVNTNEHSHAILFRWNSPKLNTNASRHASRSSAAM